MNRIRRLLTSLSAVLLLLLATPAPAFALDPLGSVDCSGTASKSTVCTDRNPADNPISGNSGVIMKAVNLIAFIAGIIAVIIIVIAGFRMVTSGGGDGFAAARRSLIYALVGLVIIVFARTLIAFVISKS